jgi:hypothetical protein
MACAVEAKEREMRRVLSVASGFVLLVAALFPSGALAAGGVSGAIFTTNAACIGTNVNIFASKDAVYLDGGPHSVGAAGLPNGAYFVKVTEPSGAVLGKTLTASVSVVGGEFVQCYRLSAILSSFSSNFTATGYDTTTNNGGEYKVWVSQDSTFTNSDTKTDNFKVREQAEEIIPATLNVNKFYDANLNGINDDSQPITGWKIRIQDGIDIDRYTPVTVNVDPDTYNVSEYAPTQTNWVSTTANPVTVTLAAGETKTVEFGNVCLGAGGGLTLGFWSNKNGQALVGADDLALLTGLNLRNANGTAFDPASNAALRTWLLNATATNMAYMLSAQLAAMELNVLNGFVSSSSLIYAPGTISANSLGFATVGAVMIEANSLLGAYGTIGASSSVRTLAEALKNALDKANNNLNFLQGTPCAFSF